MEKLEVALLADFHYGFPEDRDMSEYLEPVIEKMIEDINQQAPDLVVALGDFIQHSNRETDLERLEKVGELLEKIDVPVYAIPGNHDPMTVSKQEVMKKIDVENSETYFSLEIEGRKLIFLDTIKQIDDLYGAGMLGSEQRKWLEKELETEKEIIIFSHHLLHHRNLDGNWFFDEHPELAACIDKKDFQEIAGENLRAVFSAHIHEAGLEKFKDVPHFTTSGMDKYNPPEIFEENHAFVEITDEKILFRTRDIELEY